MFLVIGMTLNFQVITSNGGKMPVYLFEKDWKYNLNFGSEHFWFDSPEDVNLFLLSDILYLGFAVISIGDFIMFIAFSLQVGNLINMGIKYRRSKNENKNKQQI